MTKELSKQICELCGIDYEKKFSYFVKYSVKKYPDRECSEGVSKDIIGVLDFGIPENFLKLFNLEYVIPDNEYGNQPASIVFLVLYNYSKSSDDYNTKGILKLLLKALDDFEYAEYIKKAIKETEWIYE